MGKGMVFQSRFGSPYHLRMIFRISTFFVGVVALLGFIPIAMADGTRFPGARALGTGGALRGAATGDSAPQLNPSGIMLIRTMSLEGSYQYGKSAGSHDLRVSVVDSFPGIPIGGALYYNYHKESPQEVSLTGHQVGISLCLPILELLFFGVSPKYLYLPENSDTHNFTLDIGVTLRPIPQLSFGAVGYNLLEVRNPWISKSLGGGVAVLPVPSLLLAVDSVIEKVYDDSSRSKAISYMGGVEYSFVSSGAVRIGGGHDGFSKNAYLSGGVSGFSVELGALDLGVRQDISGKEKTTMLSLCARGFVGPRM
jgi:hypothetical protein